MSAGLSQIPELFQRGIAVHQSGNLSEAEQIYRQILGVEPLHAAAMQQLGVAALQTSHPAEAAELIARAISIDGSNPDWHINLGAAMNALNRPLEAMAAFRAAIAIDPGSAVAYSNLAAVLKDIDLDEAIAVGRRAVGLASDPIAHSNLLLSLSYRLTDPRQLLAEHRAWAQRFADPLHESHRPHENDRRPDRPLRLGYVSADFRDHAMAHFLLPLLANHDRGHFEVVCFDETRRPDAVTDRFKSLAARWIRIAGLPPQQVAEIVRAEKIDILIDLAGHFAGNRLLVFARRPAPVQVSCIGYPCTTGLSQIDYRLSDPICDPAGSEAHHSEKLIRLPDILWCYQPPEGCPDVIDLPAAECGGAITFGCANVFAKITPAALDLWGRILARVPNSRLALQASAFEMDRPRQAVIAALRPHGVDESRIQFIARQPMAEHLRTLSRFDIALDTFPFNGGTTTCHSLWMGAPAVTLAGNRQASRMGASMLSSISRRELIAQTPEEYVEVATQLALDPNRLRQIRRSMRNQMKDSRLTDAPRFARAIEGAYREMWISSCA